MAPSCITSSNQVGSATTSTACSAASVAFASATDEFPSVELESVALVSSA